MRYNPERTQQVQSDIRAGDRYVFVGINRRDPQAIELTIDRIDVTGELTIGLGEHFVKQTIPYSTALLLIEQGIWQEAR